MCCFHEIFAKKMCGQTDFKKYSVNPILGNLSRILIEFVPILGSKEFKIGSNGFKRVQFGNGGQQ